MNLENVRPKKRSKLRITLGKIYYTYKRKWIWVLKHKSYARQQSEERLSYQAITHCTPLLRQLKNVDMWYQHNKIINLQIAIKQLDGLILEPGKTFSYWRSIGKPTRRKGYVEGMVLHYGKFMPGIGGGLCQLSNLIFWMTLHTPLQITERHRHSFDVFPDSNRTQPFGSGATCSYNYMDLQIHNPSANTYQLSLKLKDGYLIGEWRCSNPQLYRYEVYEGSHHIQMAYWGSYIRNNTIRRRIYNGQNVQLDDEFIAENYAIMMYQPYLEHTDTRNARRRS
ncbi:VanW family protein [Pseudalkalibacillus sp. SCS-8]|uniref:VanW family protein n=1 Tax=Pseudalkalibacillus nanhaiensis TaxID=3115291 RepID=UPI0032DA805A